MAENQNEHTSEGRTPNLLKRVFIETFNNDRRALFGTLTFVAVILLVVWAALNEPVRMSTFTSQYEGRSIERGAVIFNENCASCHGLDGQGLEGIAPSLNAPDLFDGSRLEAVDWTGTLSDYVELTVAAGRPAMSAAWPQPMPTWSQEYGGPMRPDQVRDVTRFVLNYGRFYEEGYAPPDLTGPELPTPEAPAYVAVGTDLTIELPPGDPVRGEALFNSQEAGPDGTILACQSCHSLDGSTLVGPSMQGMARPERLPAGYESLEVYIRESIVNPEAFKPAGFEDINMVANFGDRLDAQSLADLIAYLLTLD